MFCIFFIFFFFNDTATTEIYTLSLHDALPIYPRFIASHAAIIPASESTRARPRPWLPIGSPPGDRKSTRLNSSHSQISYAVFCLKKKKKNTLQGRPPSQRPATLATRRLESAPR